MGYSFPLTFIFSKMVKTTNQIEFKDPKFEETLFFPVFPVLGSSEAPDIHPFVSVENTCIWYILRMKDFQDGSEFLPQGCWIFGSNCNRKKIGNRQALNLQALGSHVFPYNHVLTAERHVFVVPKPNQTCVFCTLKQKFEACNSCILVGFCPHFRTLLNEVPRFDPWGPSVTVVGEWIVVPWVIVTRATLWLCQNSYWSHGPVEIVDLATENCDFPISFLYVYQRVYVDNIG